MGRNSNFEFTDNKQKTKQKSKYTVINEIKIFNFQVFLKKCRCFQTFCLYYRSHIQLQYKLPLLD